MESNTETKQSGNNWLELENDLAHSFLFLSAN